MRFLGAASLALAVLMIGLSSIQTELSRAIPLQPFHGILERIPASSCRYPCSSGRDSPAAVRV